MKHIPLILLLTGTALGLSACSPTVKQWIDPDRTFKSLKQPQVDGVNETLEKQAKAALKDNDPRRASQFYEQLIGSKKGTAAEKLRYKLGFSDCLRRLGDPDALAAYDEILKDNPDNLEAQEGRGLTLMAMGKATDAGRAFSDIMKVDAKRWRTLNALGILFVTKNMVPEAMAYYTEALKQSPDNPAVLNNVGLSQAVDKNYPRAMAALEQASRVSGGGERRRQIDLNLAMVYAASGDLDTAKDIASKYLQGPTLDNNLGLYAHLAKNDGLAKTYLNMALSGSQTYYERAWTNLEILDSGTASDPTVPQKPAVQVKKTVKKSVKKPAKKNTKN